jgi:hypothetical protein
MTIQFLGPGGGNLAMEDVLCDGMRPFRVMEGSKPDQGGATIRRRASAECASVAYSETTKLVSA